MNTKKILALAMCAVLLVVSTVFVTVAFLTSKDTVTNTFAVGNVVITLDEALVGDDGQEITGEGADRVEANTYKLIPGKTYDKDPIVHVDANSEECFLFVKVENGIDAIEGTIEDQIEENGWKELDGVEGVYYFTNNTANPVKVAGGEDKTVFETFTVNDDVANTALAAYENATIKVTAYAIQAEGLEAVAADLWEEVKNL